MDFFNTITNNRLWTKHGAKFVWAIALLFLACILMSVGWTAWQQKNIKQTNYQAQEIAPLRAISKPTYRVNDIVSANLFGDPTPAPVVTIAPKTTLDLTLMGVLWSSDNSVGRAIIKSGKKKSVLYSVDEKIEGANAKVDEIRDAEVILNRNGALESLPLNKLTDSNNRIAFSYADEQGEKLIEHIEQIDKITSSNTKINNRQTAASNTENDDSRRVRRPNFSGLDRALEKMGEL